MGRRLLILLPLCFLVLTGSHASVSPEEYWKSKLPTTPMPESIKDSILSSGKVSTKSLADTNGYDGMLSYKETGPPKSSLDSSNGCDGVLSHAKDSVKKSLGSDNQYIGLLSYAKDLPKDSLTSTNGYDGLLSYAQDSVKNSLGSDNQYGALLSYGKDLPKDSLASTNGYDGLLSYAKDSVKNSLGSDNQYGALLSYGKDLPKDSLANTNGYDGLLSYAKDSVKNSLGNDNQYIGLLSYAKDLPKDSLASTNGYDGLLSYAKDSVKNSLGSDNQYGGLLSYAKDLPKDSLTSTNGYDGLLSYVKDSVKNSLGNDNQYGGLLSYAKVSRKLLADTNGYDGLLSYAKESPKPDTLLSKSSSTNDIMKDHAFFVEADLHHEKKIALIFQKGTKKNIMSLPREVSDKLPFSSNKIADIYTMFAVDPKSQEANVLLNRVKLCEEPKVENVEKKCVTSVESMVDFVISEIGHNVKALTTNLEKDYPKMEYTIKEVKKISKNDHETVVCHKMGYPYAVYFCHGTATIRAYKVSMVGNDGTKIDAIAACHKETNAFLSKYMVDVLKVVPGSTRVCHFPGAEDNIIWVAE